MNMTKQIKKTAILLVSLTALVFGATANAKPHKGPRHNGMQDSMRIIMKKLDLTDEQVEQIRAIKDAQKEKMKVMREEHKASGTDIRTQMTDILMAEEFSESDYLALKAQMNDKKEEVALMQAKAMNEVFQLLTDEQKVEFKAIQAERQERAEKKRKERKERKEK